MVIYTGCRGWGWGSFRLLNVKAVSSIQLGVVLVGDHADGIQHAVELLKDGGPLHITLNGLQRQRRLLSLFEQLDHLVDAVADLVRCLQ